MVKDLEEKRNNLAKLLETAKTRVDVLEADEKVKEYKKLSSKFSKGNSKLKELDFKIARDRMRECSHIFVIGLIDRSWDGHRTDTNRYHCCIKCGLDERYVDYDYNRYAAPLQKEMEYIYRETSRNGIFTKIICALPLGMSIYERILRTHPNISDEMAIKYFKAALYNIRENKATEDAKNNRIQRLGLRRDFKSWGANSVVRGD